MKLPSFLRRRIDPSQAARVLAEHRRLKGRALIRATADEMRAQMGMAPANWPA